MSLPMSKQLRENDIWKFLQTLVCSGLPDSPKGSDEEADGAVSGASTDGPGPGAGPGVGTAPLGSTGSWLSFLPVKTAGRDE